MAEPLKDAAKKDRVLLDFAVEEPAWNMLVQINKLSNCLN